MKFRNLKHNEIEVRVQSVKEKGYILLLYKDARADMKILDETVGSLNWKREHSRDNSNCIVSVWDDKKLQWVSKEDTGTESNTEKEKGKASDSFKRACVNWGIGRELYSSPFIYVSDTTHIKSYNGKPSVSEKFKVTVIGCDDDNDINKLVIVDSKGKQVYSFGSKSSSAKKEVAKTDIEKITEKCSVEQIEKILSNYKKDCLNNLTEVEVKEVMNKLKIK